LPITSPQEWFSIQIHTTCSARAGADPAQPHGVVGAAADVVAVVDVVEVGVVVDAGRALRGVCEAGKLAPPHAHIIVVATTSTATGFTRNRRVVAPATRSPSRALSRTEILGHVMRGTRRVHRASCIETRHHDNAWNLPWAIVVFDRTASRASFVIGRAVPASVFKQS
jgi:hypothetical protein